MGREYSWGATCREYPQGSARGMARVGTGRKVSSSACVFWMQLHDFLSWSWFQLSVSLRSINLDYSTTTASLRTGRRPSYLFGALS